MCGPYVGLTLYLNQLPVCFRSGWTLPVNKNIFERKKKMRGIWCIYRKQRGIWNALRVIGVWLILTGPISERNLTSDIIDLFLLATGVPGLEEVCKSRRLEILICILVLSQWLKVLKPAGQLDKQRMGYFMISPGQDYYRGIEREGFFNNDHSNSYFRFNFWGIIGE